MLVFISRESDFLIILLSTILPAISVILIFLTFSGSLNTILMISLAGLGYSFILAELISVILFGAVYGVK